MGKANIGDLIKTATKNIYYERELSEEERSLATQLAPYIHQNQRNWTPVFVQEIGRHNYQLIGSPVILEANKLAGLEITYCIQVDEDENVKTQIEKSQISPVANSGKNDLMPLMNRLEELEKQLKQQNEKVEQIFQQVVPDDQLAINQESKELLQAKLSLVPGIGEKTLPKLIKEILNERPFYGAAEMKAKVSFLKPTKSKAKRPRYQQLWEDITRLYQIDYTVPT